jgi:GDPmannose 4,6-dehydratase
MREHTAIVTGATGQDGSYLVRRLLDDGWVVHAPVRDAAAAELLFPGDEQLEILPSSLAEPARLASLIAEVQPDELYNLAGESSVANSFADPHSTWQTNAYAVVHLLDAVRKHSPLTHFYQASSSEMFGFVPGGEVVHDENSPLNPQSPYAAAKAAAHLLCRSYRESYGIRVASGILFNHESHRRDTRFLTRKIVDRVAALRRGETAGSLYVGNLKARRDWGFAPDYVDGIVKIIRQTNVRGDPDAADKYRDYVLGTGRLYHVWELVDRAFALGGFELRWQLDGEDPTGWYAALSGSNEKVVVVDPDLVRPADPAAIAADPTRARIELDWQPRVGLDVFLCDMLDATVGNRVVLASPTALPTAST